MLECLILGDSIAVGIAQHRPECVTYATVGINSRKFVDHHIAGDLNANTVVISLGANDSKNIQTLKELFALRQVIGSKHVIWVLPANNKPAAEAVGIVADKFEDKSMQIAELSKDHVHPTGKEYKRLAELSKQYK
jgi:lysophospholipase L1-like esterase